MFYGIAAGLIALTVVIGLFVDDTGPFAWGVFGLILVWILTKPLTLWAQRIVQFRNRGKWPDGTEQDVLYYAFGILATGVVSRLFGEAFAKLEKLQNVPDEGLFRPLYAFFSLAVLFLASAGMVREFVVQLRPQMVTLPSALLELPDSGRLAPFRKFGHTMAFVTLIAVGLILSKADIDDLRHGGPDRTEPPSSVQTQSEPLALFRQFGIPADPRHRGWTVLKVDSFQGGEAC